MRIKQFKKHPIFIYIASLVLFIFTMGSSVWAHASQHKVFNEKPRVIISTDIGGTDFDDFQSLIHLFIYADRMDIEGLISSPWGSERDRVKQIHTVIDQYALDYPNLKTYSPDYPTPEYLHSISKQGGLDSAPAAGYSQPTDGSELIISAANKLDPRPLWVLVWGGIDDLAQALHDDPGIASKLHVYYIGGPNKKWATAAYTYIAQNFPDLFFIENNSSYRGWFTGGDQTGDLDGTTFINTYLKDHGALGNLFTQYGDGKFKMGDSPSVAYVLGPNPEQPDQDSLGGGYFVRAWDRPFYTFDRALNVNDKVETYSIVELIVHPSSPSPASPLPEDMVANLVVPSSATSVNRFPGFLGDDGAWHFRFSPKASQIWTYTIESNWKPLDQISSGTFTSVPASAEQANHPSAVYTHWWTDNPDPSLSENIAPYGPQHGIKTINQWRASYLYDFAHRAERLLGPKTTKTP